jgi:hypothetical protein
MDTIMEFGKPFESGGEWWLPEKPGIRLKGVLKYDPEKTLELILTGESKEIKDFLNYRDNVVNYPVIVERIEIISGLLDNNADITLYNKNNGYWLLKTLVINPSIAIPGKRYEQLSDIEFSKITVEFTDLDTWVSRRSFKNSFYFDKRGTVLESALFEFEPFEKKVEIVKEQAILELNVYGTMDYIDSLDVNIKTNAIINLTNINTDNGIGLERAVTLLYGLKNLLTVLIWGPVYFKNLRVYLRDDNGLNNYNNTTDLIIAENIPKSIKRKDTTKMLFTFPLVRDHIDVVINTWFENIGKMMDIYILLLTTFYNEKLDPGNYFLNIVQALEGFHRRFFVGEYISKKEYDKHYLRELKTLIDGLKIPDKYMETVKPVKQRLKSLLRYGYQYGLRARLREMIKTFEPKTIEYIRENREDFIRFVAGARDELSHRLYGEKDEDVSREGLEKDEKYDPRTLYIKYVELKILLAFLILVNLGLPESVIQEREKDYQFINTCIWR